MVGMDSSSQHVNLWPKSAGLICGLVAAWRCCAFIKWTWWSLTLAMLWWQHHKQVLSITVIIYAYYDHYNVKSSLHCQLKLSLSPSALVQSRTHGHGTLILLTYLALLGVTSTFFDIAYSEHEHSAWCPPICLWFACDIRRYIQGDHSPDNEKFPDGLWHSSAALGMLSVTHIMSVLVLLLVMG